MKLSTKDMLKWLDEIQKFSELAMSDEAKKSGKNSEKLRYNKHYFT